MIIISLIVVFVLVVASNWWFGLWANLITLVNITLAGLIATSFYQNVAHQLGMLDRTYVAVWGFISAWLIFVLALGILRGISDGLSSMRLRFDRVTEITGRSILSIMVGVAFVCFTSFTLHLAPLPVDLFGTKAVGPNQGAIGPDRLWLGLVRNLSTNSLSYTAEETQFFPAYNVTITRNEEEPEKLLVRVFDPTESFFFAGRELRRVIAGNKTLRLGGETE